MNDVQRIAEERAAQPRTRPIGSSMQSEHRIAKNAVVQQNNALDGTRIQKIDAVDDRKQSMPGDTRSIQNPYLKHLGDPDPVLIMRSPNKKAWNHLL